MKITDIKQIREDKIALQDVIKNMIIAFNDEHDVNVIGLESYFIDGRGLQTSKLIRVDIKIEL